MKSRRSFLKFLALAPVAVAASSKVVEAVATAASVPATTAHGYMTPACVAAAVRGDIPGLVQCDEFGRPYHQRSPEFEAQIDAMRIRHSNANVDALFRYNDYLQKLSAKHHASVV